jgi:glycosyltransferase involved in cell wall biosynthesis
LLGAVKEGTPVIASNDVTAWRAAAAIATRNPAIGVLHADEEAYYELARRYRDAVSALVCVSRRIAHTTRARLGDRIPPLPVIPCGVIVRDPVRRNDTGAGVQLVWVGRIEQRQKRVLDLPAILQRLGSLGTDARLTIIGEGPDRSSLLSAMGADLKSRVRWLGWLDAERVRHELSQADILLLPSAFEGMPLVVMEALAEGCAVVSSNVSGVEDLASHPLAVNCLWTHEVGDVDAAVKLVQRAEMLPRVNRRAAARELAVAECSLKVCVDRYESLLLSGAAPGAREPGGSGSLQHLGAKALSMPLALLRQVRLRFATTRR